MQTTTQFHLGEAICSKIEKDGRTKKWLAKQIGCDRSSLSRMLANKSLNTGQLINICVALNHNFFEELATYCSEKLKTCK